MDQQNADDPISRATLVSDEDVKPQVENRADKQRDGICVRKRCRARADDGSDYCKRHGRLQRQYHREYMARRREKWDAAGVCTQCGRTRAPESKWCAGCLIEHGKVHRQDVKSQVENHRARVEARKIAWSDSPTNQGRKNRLRGGKRGRRSIGDDDKERLLALHKFVVKADEGMGYALSAEVMARGAIQRLDAKHAALSWVLLIVRTGVEMLKANNYPVPAEADHNISIDDDDE